MQNISKALAPLFEGLTDRQRAIVQGAFGIGGSPPQTLAALGHKYSITRERARQLKLSTLRILKRKLKAVTSAASVVEEAVSRLKAAGGALREDALLKELGSTARGFAAGELRLLASVSESFVYFPPNGSFYASYALDRASFAAAHKWLGKWIRYLRTHKKKVLEEGYGLHFKKYVLQTGINQRYAEHYAALSKLLWTNSYGDTGLIEWKEIRPATIRDRIYLVLKKKGAPLHFKAVAEEISRMRLQERSVLVPTVHNELIKDPRFVLVGRGIYALAEAGYQPGTVREVIQRILAKHGPLTVEDIIRRVGQERFFKPTTVLVNLQNRKYFERSGDKLYRVREA